MDEAADFARLIDGLRAGDRAATEQAYARYGPFLRAAVRRRLHPRMRTRFDSLDFVQDVWASVLALPLEKYQFRDPDAFLGFLNRVAVNKVVEMFRRRFATAKDDITREEPIRPDSATARQPTSTPTPSQHAIAREELELLMSQLPAGHREIVLRLRDGYQIDDIARLTGVSPSTVNRVVRRLKDIVGV